MDKDGRIKFVKNLVITNKTLLEEMKNEWRQIGEFEYIFSPAFGGERINVLEREIGKPLDIYPILFACDFEDLI